MIESLTLSIDAMGGDNAPNMVIEGIEVSLERYPQVKFLLFGDKEQLIPILDRHPIAAKASEIRHTDEAISNEQKVSSALRSGKKSSMRLAIDTVSTGEASGVISAGNTGALMAMAKFVLKTLPGIDRPAIAAYYPTERGRSVMLDLGANIDCNAGNLVQFAVMGEVFARNVLDLKNPSIGILNVGSENLKGNEAVKTASVLLQDSTLPIKFHGFIEGDDIGKGIVDVVVTDGFTGNVALKTAEGTAKLFGFHLKQALSESLLSKFAALIASKSLKKFKNKFDPRLYNGAMFLGLNGICIKSHGGTDALGFANAIHVAIEMITHSFNEGIKEDYAKISEHIPALKDEVKG
mgnify:CR=1 FL=1